MSCNSVSFGLGRLCVRYKSRFRLLICDVRGIAEKKPSGSVIRLQLWFGALRRSWDLFRLSLRLSCPSRDREAISSSYVMYETICKHLRRLANIHLSLFNFMQMHLLYRYSPELRAECGQGHSAESLRILRVRSWPSAFIPRQSSL